MITKEKLKDYAGKLMFDMKEEEYETLQKEFDIILKQMELIEEIDGIKEIEPMTFPFEMDSWLREDDNSRSITVEEALSNADSIKGNEVKVPKVVE